MNPSTSFEQDLESWLRAEAPADPPVGLHGAALERVRVTRQRSGRRVSLGRWPGHARRMALLAAAAVLLVGGALAGGSRLIQHRPAVFPGASQPATAAPSRSLGPVTSMWPQSTLEEVRAAQGLADAGDPRYAWQTEDLAGHLGQGGPFREQLYTRFLAEKLGWDGAQWTLGDLVGNGIHEFEGRVVFLRCATADPCEPTIDGSRYEAVAIDVAQLARQGPTGIWVVTGWTMLEPFEPDSRPVLDPSVVGLLDGFVAARIAGAGAERYLDGEDVPLLYATSSGAPYERAEYWQVLGYDWPYGDTAFLVSLYAGDTWVEQLLFLDANGRTLRLGYVPDGYGTEIAPTTEDGRPVGAPYEAFDGQVTLYVAHPWVARYGELTIRLIPETPGTPPTTDGGERNDWQSLAVIADPVRTGAGCPQDQASADAKALAQSIRSDPGLVATAPVPMDAGGAPGLVMDVVIAPGASSDPGCVGLSGGTGGMPWLEGSVSVAPGERMRLYLFDAPEGASMRTLAVGFALPEARFDRASQPIRSVEFHVADDTVPPPDASDGPLSSTSRDSQPTLTQPDG